MAGGIGAFLASALFSPLAGLAILFVTVNDVRYVLQHGAIDVEAKAVDAEPAEPLTLPPAEIPADAPRYRVEPLIASRPVVGALIEPLKSTIIVGQPGAGKGMVAAHATRALKAVRPELQIWAIDPKAEARERWYWDACDRVLHHRLDEFASEVEVKGFQAAVTEFIKQFQAVTGPKLLILDEGLACREICEKAWWLWLIKGCNSICSMGRSSEKYVWILTQSPNADDVGVSAGVRNVYRRILLLGDEDTSLLDNGSTFFSGRPDTWGESGRAYYDSLERAWFPVEILEIPAKELRQVRHQAGEAIQVDSANSSEILARISHAESLNQSLLQEVRRLSESLESVIQFVRSDSGIPNTSQNAPIEGIGEGDERAESTTESTSETVLRLAGLGWSKNDIIRHVWGASPGGSRAYKDAKAEYEAIVG